MTIYLVEGTIIFGSLESFSDGEDDMVIPNADSDTIKKHANGEPSKDDITGENFDSPGGLGDSPSKKD